MFFCDVPLRHSATSSPLPWLHYNNKAGHRGPALSTKSRHPRDAQAMLNSEIFGNCVIAPFTRDYVRAAAHERIG